MNLLKRREKATHTLVDIEIDKDFTLKPIFGGDFGLLNVDLLETLGTGTFGRVRLVRLVISIHSKPIHSIFYYIVAGRWLIKNIML